jgi:hypothetical protein
VSETEDAYALIDKLRAELQEEKLKRHVAETELDQSDDKIAQLRLRLDAARQEIKRANRVAKLSSDETAAAHLDMIELKNENVRLRQSIESETPADAMLYALRERDAARRDAAVERTRAETAERRVLTLRMRLQGLGETVD